jgi:hypothetical protein
MGTAPQLLGQSCNTQQGHIHSWPARLTLHSGWWYRQSRDCTCCSAMPCEHRSTVQKIRQRMLCNAQQALLTQSHQCVGCMSDTKTGHVDVAIIANCGEDQQNVSNDCAVVLAISANSAIGLQQRELVTIGHNWSATTRNAVLLLVGVPGCRRWCTCQWCT